MSEIFVEHNIDDWQHALETLGPEVTRRVMKQVVDTAERETLRRYRRTSSNWRNRPTFNAIKEHTATSYSVLVGTDSLIYKFVDLGTKPHTIVPRAPGYPLRFQVGYQARTIPGVLASGPNGATGPEVRAMRVQHPGTEARGFSEQIHKEVGPMAFDLTLKLLDKELRRHFRWAQRR